MRALNGLPLSSLARDLGVSRQAVYQHLRGAKRDGLADSDGTSGGWRLTGRGLRIVRALAEVAGERG